MTNPFKPIVTTISSTPRSPMSWCIKSGKLPRRIPWRATALMTPRMRLPPRATKFNATAMISSGSRSWVTGYLTSKMMPKADNRQAATSSSGTCVSRSRAMLDSTTPISTATSSIAADENGQSSQGLPVASGQASACDQRREYEQF